MDQGAISILKNWIQQKLMKKLETCRIHAESAPPPERALDIQLTFSLPAAYSLRCNRCWCPDDRRPPEGLTDCAFFSRTTHSTRTDANCSAGRPSSRSRHRYSTCSII